jgi:hypothetical protein
VGWEWDPWYWGCNRPIVPASNDRLQKWNAGIRIGKESWSNWRKPAPVPFCPPHTVHELMCDWMQTIYLSMALQPFVGPWPDFKFLHLFTQSVGLLGQGISLSQGCYLYTGQHKQNKRRQTSVPQVGFEPTTPVFELAKTVPALECWMQTTTVKKCNLSPWFECRVMAVRWWEHEVDHLCLVPKSGMSVALILLLHSLHDVVLLHEDRFMHLT